MKTFHKKSIFFLLLFIFDSTWALSCTTFCLDIQDRPIYGRNFDWRLGDGRIYINKRGVAKKAFSATSDDAVDRLSWVSKYGSATFNLFGREFPMGGMNEAGLVVESMMLDETQYPAEDSRPEIMASQWIQYQLDNFSRVEEVISSASEMRIQASRDSKLHFFICERSGICATIEFIEGKLVYHTDERLPVKTLTNSPYTESLSFWRNDELPQHDSTNSIERFIRTANQIKGYDSHTIEYPIEYAFEILNNAEHESYITQWSIVYDIEALEIHFRTHGNKKTRYFNLKSFDFSCSTPVTSMDMDKKYFGNVADKFVEYSYQDNRNYIRNFHFKSYFSTIPDPILNKFSGYPETTFCN